MSGDLPSILAKNRFVTALVPSEGIRMTTCVEVYVWEKATNAPKADIAYCLAAIRKAMLAGNTFVLAFAHRAPRDTMKAELVKAGLEFSKGTLH